jgi:hypothetical protein
MSLRKITQLFGVTCVLLVVPYREHFFYKIFLPVICLHKQKGNFPEKQFPTIGYNLKWIKYVLE